MNPEKQHNQTAPTTVGGVTFGGGQPAPTTAQNTTPQPQPQAGAPVDPIFESTGEEFDAVMNGTATPNQDFNQAPVPNAMQTQIASPTHFDSQNTVKPIVVDPGNPNGFKMPQNQPQKKPLKSAEELDKQARKFATLSVIFGILTAIATVLAVVGLVMGVNTQVENTELQAEIEKKEEIIRAVEETTGISPIDDATKVPVYKATTGYIYIDDWDIKIRVPENLSNLSFILNNINFHPSICFNGMQKDTQYFPDFANIALNPGRMGCLTRINTAEGEFDAATGISYGEKVFTYKDYSYFYTPSIDYSKDEANLGLERTAVRLIYNMLRDNIEQYE
ncbi:hypothetical protein J6X90_03410 [Candidatus Saccharibacteria bacterium]|nr:hypothetical protein [Candidatus Saccharibacteria bacterium]